MIAFSYLSGGTDKKYVVSALHHEDDPDFLDYQDHKKQILTNDKTLQDNPQEFATKTL